MWTLTEVIMDKCTCEDRDDFCNYCREQAEIEAEAYLSQYCTQHEYISMQVMMRHENDDLFRRIQRAQIAALSI